VTGVISDTRYALDHDRDPWQGPQVGGETMCARPFAQREVNPLPLRRIEFGRTARPLGATQRIRSSALPLCVPAACTLAADLEEARHFRHDLAGDEQLGSAPSSFLQTLEVPSSTTLQPHEGMLHDANDFVTLFCEIQ